MTDIPPVSAIADVLKLWGRDGWLTPPLKAVVSSSMPVMGTATTISILAGESGPGLAPVYSLLSRSLSDRFVVVAGASAVDGAVWGEIMSAAASGQGAAGALVDGCVRDAGEMEQIGLPVYATAGCVVGPNGTAHAVAVDDDVVIGGVVIAAGDTLVADETGCVRIPQAHVDEVLGAARAYAAAEAQVVQALRAGEPLTTAYLHKKTTVDELRR